MPLVVKTTGVEEYLDASGQAHIKALILGEPSAGKTRSASFWPKPIFADCEKGRMSIADRKVPYVEITSSADMDAFLSMLEYECTKPVEQRKYQTAVIDTIDSFQRVVIQEILKAGKKDAMSGWQDWGALDAKMSALVARLHKLAMNIVVNSHVKRTQDGTDGPLISEPKLKGDLREQISAEFDLVGQMATFWEAENGERVLKRAIKWHPEPGFPILKDRSGQLPKYTDVAFTEQDYSKLFELMFLGDHFDSLTESQQVDELPTDTDNVEAPRAGGPVAAAKPAAKAEELQPKAEPKPRKAARKGPAARQATPTPTQPNATIPGQVTYSSAQPATPPARATSAPPAPAFQPPMPQAAQEAAEQVVADTLGGTVVATEVDSPTAGAESDPMPVTQDPPSGLMDGQAPATAIACGSPAVNGLAPAPGCGTDVNAFPDQNMVNLAVVRAKTYLCPDCFVKWKTNR